MADSQVPWGVGALGGAVSDPGWRVKPSWYLVASDDRMIPPPAQHAMAERAGATVVEVPGSHSVYLSRPEAVATSSDKPLREPRNRTRHLVTMNPGTHITPTPCAVGVALECDGGDGDARERGELRLDLVERCLAGRQAEPPPIASSKLWMS